MLGLNVNPSRTVLLYTLKEKIRNIYAKYTLFSSTLKRVGEKIFLRALVLTLEDVSSGPKVAFR